MSGRSDESEVARRIEEVLRLILDGWQHHEIVHHFAEKEPAVQERQTREYIRRAYDRLAETQERKRKRLVSRHLAQRQAIFRRALDEGDLKTALATLDSECKLLGLFPNANAKELAKLAAALGMKAEELEKRVRDARPNPSTTEEGRAPTEPSGGSVAADDGPVDGVEG